MEEHVSYYRCPECHHIFEKDQLFREGCPICGWTSPLSSKKPIPSSKHIMDMLPSGTNFNAPAWRELGKKKVQCPSCGNERDEEEWREKGCLICGYFPGSRAGRKVPISLEREEFMDIFDRQGYLEIVMDVQGVEGKNIKAEVVQGGRKLLITIPDKDYRKEIDLPCPVTAELTVSLKHGTLWVKAKKHAD